MNLDNCIVYALVDPRDETTRYIGITSNASRRRSQHLEESRPIGGMHYQHWQAELRFLGLKPGWKVLEKSLTWEEACKLEREWIAHGKKEDWPLVNATDGGGGINPEKARLLWIGRSKEERQRILGPLHEAAHSPETRAKAAKTLRRRGFWDYDEERKKKCGNGRRGKKNSPEARAKISAALKGCKKSPEHIANATAAMKATKNTPEWKAEIRARGSMRWPKTDEQKRKLSEGVKAAWERGNFGEERNRKISASMKGRSLTEEHGRNISEGKKKDYPALYNVETEEVIPPGRGLGDMGREHNLNRGSIGQLVRGIRMKPFKSWILLDNMEVKRNG